MDIFDNMRRDKNYFIFLYLGNNALKAQAFLGIESRGRLIKNENIRVSEQSLGYSRAANHSAGERLDLLFGAVGEVN